MARDLLDKCSQTYDTFENISGIYLKFTKYFKESCELDFDQHFYVKCFSEDCFYWRDILKIVESVLGLRRVWMD